MRHEDTSGLLLALAGFALLSLGDATIKTMAGDWPPTAVAALRFTIGAAGLGVLVAAHEGRRGFAVRLPGWQLLRGAAIAVAAVSFFAGVFLMPLAEATAITFTTPMWTALLAAALLRERVRRVTWLAILAAFAGVLLILRPSAAALDLAALLPLVSAVATALLLVGNRRTAGSASPLALQFVMAAIAAPLLTLLAAAGHFADWPELDVPVPHWTVVARCAFVALTATSGHFLIFLGTTRASAARVAPMSYVQLLVTSALGWLVFGERPGALAIAGAAMIVGAGLLLWRVEPEEAAGPPARPE